MNLLEMYFSPSGRINRSTYWQQGILLLNVIWGLSVAVVIVIALVSTDTNVDRLLDDILFRDPGNFILLIFFIVILVAIYWWNNFAVAVKRLHDRDKSAWWLVLWWAISGIGGALTFGIASFVVAVWMLVELGFLEGTPGENRYDDSGGYAHRQSGYGSGNQSAQLSGAAQATLGRQKACPYCGEFIPNAATICRYCGSDVPTARQSAGSSAAKRTKNCPHCAETIMYEAKKCRYCGSDLPTPPAPQAASPTPTGRRTKTCSYCAETILYEELKCRYCGSDVPTPPAPQAASPTPSPQQASPTPSPQGVNPTPAVRRMKTCPNCAESIAYEELKCRHCGSEVPN